MSSAEIYEDLCIAAEAQGLRLELFVSTKRQGENGHEWRALERLDLTTADRRCALSALIVPGPSGGIAGAAALLLEKLTSTAA